MITAAGALDTSYGVGGRKVDPALKHGGPPLFSSDLGQHRMLVVGDEVWLTGRIASSRSLERVSSLVESDEALSAAAPPRCRQHPPRSSLFQFAGPITFEVGSPPHPGERASLDKTLRVLAGSGEDAFMFCKSKATLVSCISPSLSVSRRTDRPRGNSAVPARPDDLLDAGRADGRTDLGRERAARGQPFHFTVSLGVTDARPEPPPPTSPSCRC